MIKKIHIQLNKRQPKIPYNYLAFVDLNNVSLFEIEYDCLNPKCYVRRVQVYLDYSLIINFWYVCYLIVCGISNKYPMTIKCPCKKEDLV